MMPIVPEEHVFENPLGEAAQRHVDKLMKEFRHVKSRRSSEENKWKIAVDQWNSRLKSAQPRPDEPDIDMPTTRKYGNQYISRILNPFLQNEHVFMSIPVRGERMEDDEFSDRFQDFLKYTESKYSFLDFAKSFIRNSLVYPKAVAKIVTIQEEFHRGGKVEGNFKAIPEIVPTPDFFHAVPAKDINKVPWVGHRTWMSEYEIDKAIESKFFYDHKKSIMRAQDQQDSSLYLSMDDESESDEDFSNRDYEIVEFWQDINGREAILTIDVASSVLLRGVWNPFDDFKRPFIVYSYEDVDNSIDGVSMCYIIEPLHRAKSGSIRQRLRAASAALEKLVLGDSGGELRNVMSDGLRSGWIEVPGFEKNQVQEISLAQEFTQLNELEQVFDIDADKLVGLTDSNFGLEQISRPTASGQLALIEEGKQPLFTALERFREVLKKIKMVEVSRYRQFFPNSIEFYIMENQEDAPYMQYMMMQWPECYWRDAIVIDTKVSSQRINTAVKRQEIMGVIDKIPQIVELILNIASQAAQPVPQAFVAKKLLSFYVYSLGEFFEEFEVQGKEFLNVEEDVHTAAVFLQQIQQLQMQLQQYEQQNQQLQQMLQSSQRPTPAPKQEP